MMKADLNKLLSEISLPDEIEDSENYFVLPIPEFSNHLYGYTSNQYPCLLIKCVDNNNNENIPLTGVKILFNQECNIVDSEGQITTNVYTSITCTSEDQLVHKYFTYLCESMLSIIGNEPYSVEVNKALRNIINLLQKLRGPCLRDIRGLIGELLFILYSGNIKLAMQIWRENTNDNFDFNHNNIALEVKTCKSIKREHHITYEQSNPSKDLTALLVSVFIDNANENVEGMTLQELLKNISDKLSGEKELIEKLDNNVAASLGSNLVKELSFEFDKDIAINNIQLFDINKIPAIRGDLPEYVSKVNFKTDLTKIPHLKSEEIVQHKDIKELVEPFLIN